MCLAEILMYAASLVITLLISACVGFFGLVFGFIVYTFVEETGAPKFLSILLGIIVGIAVDTLFILAAELIPWHPLYLLFAVMFGVIFLVLFIRSES